MTDLIRFENWPDPLLDGRGFHARSLYAELCYTGIIGPTAIVLLRTMAFMTETAGGPVTVEPEELARSLGVGPSVSPNAPLHRSLGRLERFGLAVKVSGGYALRLVLPPLTPRQLARSSRNVQLAHQHFVDHRTQ